MHNLATPRGVSKDITSTRETQSFGKIMNVPRKPHEPTVRKNLIQGPIGAYEGTKVWLRESIEALGEI